LSDSRSPNGSATGDLSGSYPNPSVAKLQGYSVSATSPSTGQILQWGGDSWLPAAVPNGGSGGGGLVYFLNYGNTTGISPTTGLPTTPVLPSQLGRTYSVGSGSVTSGALTNGSYQFVCGFVSIVGEPNITTIPAGLWDFNIWASVSSASGNETQFQVRVFKYNSTTGIYTSVANSDDIYLYDPANISQYIANVTMPQTTILTTDRIYIELWAQKNVSGARTITFHFDSIYPSHCHTTIPSVSGTGVVKVVNAVFQTPANLIFNADVDPAAAIAQSKIANLTSDLAGKAPSTGISPSAISGTAVITTDARLSDARTPTAHASSHAVGGSDPLTASAIAALGLATDSYVIAKGGDDLIAKYIQASALTPNSSAKSATNRATLILMPGNYTFSQYYTFDVEFVDIIGLGSQTKKPSVIIQGTFDVEGDTYYNFTFNANDIRVSGLSFLEQAFYNANNKPLQIFQNCTGGDACFGLNVNLSGTFIDCVGGTQSFGGGGGGNASGTFIDCVGGYASFGGDGEVASGIFTNCTGGDISFGGAGLASGTFTNCTAGTASFGTAGSASGTFTNCTGDQYNFAGNGEADGTFIDCVGGYGSFGGGEGTPSGTFINCTLTVGTFNALTIPTSGTARMINCIDANGDLINGQQPI
jgi:hypothetical protein